MVQAIFLYRSMFIGTPPPFACSWPTCCCRTWASCCRRLRKILAWEKTERNKEVIITINPALLEITREDKEYIRVITITTNKRQTTRQRTRLKVTVCLYLNPSNSARSLSKLMTAAVARDNPQKKKLKKFKVNWRIRQFPLAIPIKKAAKSGWTITPTQKSLSKKNVERKNEYKEWSLINHPVKLTWSWEVSVFRNVHHSFDARIQELVAVLKKC